MSLPSIAKLASKHNIKPLKRLGQNFIFDESLCDRIVTASSLAPSDIAVEVGPGPAGLTRAILKCSPAKLLAIETDDRCMPLLEELQSHFTNLEIIHEDAKKISIAEIANKEADASAGARIISNLPYNIGTNLVIKWLREADAIASMTLMLQKEVVDRIIAEKGSKSYGRLSVICQLVCEVKKCFDVSPKAFYPAPKVWSSIVHLQPKAKTNRPNIETLRNVEQITNTAFSGRRKMVKSSLKQLAVKNATFKDIEELLSKCGIDASMRAENLSPADYLKLAQMIAL